MGGNADAALRRAADVAQGWYGFNLSPEETAAKIARLCEFLAERGRMREDIVVTMCPYLRPATADLVRQYREAGVDQLLFAFAAQDEDGLVRGLDELASTALASPRG